MRKPNNLPATTSATASGYTLSSTPIPSIWDNFLPDIKDWAIGFERQWDLLDSLRAPNYRASYPPYNIVKVDNDRYEIQLAVAGFSKKDVEVVKQDQVLTISGSKSSEEEQTFIHKGIGARNFKHTFALENYVEVKSASLEDGILTISLEREVPEEKKPQKITVK
jgi:molecular chaperone IbpA